MVELIKKEGPPLIRPQSSECEAASDKQFEVLVASANNLHFEALCQLQLKSSLVISFGRNTTYDIDFKNHFSPFIASHYHEDPGRFSEALDQITRARSEAACPQRSESGLRAIRTYYGLLTAIEQRFFDASNCRKLFFQWNDIFTGDQVYLRPLPFEKASFIFNYAALCSQIATDCDTGSEYGLLHQVQWFLQARANLEVLLNRFPHALNWGMNPKLLEFLMRIMQLQAQESMLAREMLECGNGSEFTKLVKYIGGASLLSEGYGELALPTASDCDTEVTTVVPSYWLELLKVKSQYYQAQINHKLAIILLCLAAEGKVPGAGPVKLKPYSEDVFLEAKVAWQLNELFTMLKPCVKLHRRLRLQQHRSRSLMNVLVTIDAEASSRPCVGLNRGSADVTSFRCRAFSEVAKPELDSVDCGGRELEEEEMAPPSNRKDAHLLGQLCLIGALYWARQTLRTIEKSSKLKREAKFKNFVDKCAKMWAEQLHCIMRSKSSSNTGTEPPSSSQPSWSANLAAITLTTSTARRGSLRTAIAAQEVEGNPWMVPTFLPTEIELPAAKGCNVFTSAENMLPESEDPFLELGPLTCFNARNKWSMPYTVQLVRDELVDYGFSVRGNGPVEITDVEEDSPAHRNGMSEGDLVVSINGMDARFMTLDQAVVAIRFGAEGFGQANTARVEAATDINDGKSGANGRSVNLATFPPRVDIVILTLIRPLSAAAKPTTFKIFQLLLFIRRTEFRPFFKTTRVQFQSERLRGFSLHL